MAVAKAGTLVYAHGYGQYSDPRGRQPPMHVRAFNNAGFSTHADSVMGYQSDPLILVPIMGAITLGSVGFPVMQDLRDRHGRKGP